MTLGSKPFNCVHIFDTQYSYLLFTQYFNFLIEFVTAIGRFTHYRMRVNQLTNITMAFIRIIIQVNTITIALQY